MMRSSRKLSVAFVAVLMVLAAGCTSVAFTNTGADTNAQMQQNTQELEPNDDRENATPFSEVGGSVEGEVNDTRANGTVVEQDVDFFKFNATAGEAINVYYGGYVGSVNITLLAPNGDVVAQTSQNEQDTSSIGGVAEETGTYYVRVNGSGSYGVEVETATSDPFGSNDDIESATPTDTGERTNGTVAKNETDFFAVEADAGETITATVALRDINVTNPGNIAVDILTAEGERLNEAAETPSGFPTNSTSLTGATSGDTESVNVTVEEAGTYYVRVEEAPASASNEFTDIGGFTNYTLTVDTSGADQPTTTPTETPTQTPDDTQNETPQPTTGTPTETPEETETPTPTETPDEPTEPAAEEGVTYYQVDFVAGEPIENLRGPEGTYTNDQLIRFVHGSTEEPIMRRAPGTFAYAENDDLAERIESHEITVENGTATITFTVAEGSESVELSLVSYTKPGPGWSPQTEAKQEFVDADTDTFGPGTYTLTVGLPGGGNETDGTTTESGEGELSIAGLSADADGDDNNNLNDEYIVYENTGDAPLDLSGWTVTDASGATFTFPDGFTLAPGEQVTLYTGSGTNTDAKLYWGQANEVWNNGADTMTVRNAAGEIVLQRSYP